MTRHVPANEMNAEAIVHIEKASIRDWVQRCSPQLTGRVLDYGSGLQPYRDIVEAAGGEYVPHDLTSYPSSVATEDAPLWPDLTRFDAILCNQVTQYVPLYEWQHGDDVLIATPLWDMLGRFHDYLTLGGRHGWLVMTGGTCWREIEPADHSRLTVAGIRSLLEQVGFHVERCESRASLDFPGFSLSLGWGCLAQA